MRNALASIRHLPKNYSGTSAMRYRILFAASIAVCLSVATVAQAQEGDDGHISGSAVASGWDVNVAGGVGTRPTFEGSDKYVTSVVPFIQATYDDMISLGVDGINGYWHHDNFRIGAGLTRDPGRNDSKSNSVFSRGDDRLNGLGDISGALGVKIFGSYKFDLVNLTSSITKFDGSENKGLLANFGADIPFKLTDRLMVVTHVGATWADKSYMETYFGVTPVQAADSAFKEYTAGSGVKDVDFGIKATYRLDQHWFIGGNIGVEKLTDDAARSPIVFSKTEPTFMAMVGYHF